MIAIAKLTGTVVDNAEVVNGRVMGPFSINGDVDFFDLYYTESDIQQRIEAAVAEHLAATQEIDDLNEYLRNQLAIWKLKCDELEGENEDLQARIAALEAARQPVEVSAELAEAIEGYRNADENFWELNVLTDAYIHPYFEIGKVVGSKELLEIIKRGYTVKPDPLRERIAAILGNDHEQLDAVVAAAREEEAE